MALKSWLWQMPLLLSGSEALLCNRPSLAATVQLKSDPDFVCSFILNISQACGPAARGQPWEEERSVWHPRACREAMSDVTL